MSEHAKSARAAMKAKAKRLGSAGDPKARVDASSWTPPEMENAGAKTGMRPISPRAYKRGGKVMHVEGEKAHHHAGRKPRKDGGKTEMPLVDRFINADRKKANRYREGGDAHVGGYKHGGAPKHKMGGGALYGLRPVNNPITMAGRLSRGYKHGGATEHDDEAADRALVKKMVKGKALTGKKHGGEAKRADGGRLTGRPLAASGLTSYRAKGPYGYIMIGAKNHDDALSEANRSSSKPLSKKDIEVWSGSKYKPIERRHGGEAGGEKWIAGAIKHPGALHKALHVPEGKKIPAKKLEKAAHSDNPKLAKRANLAKTLGRMHRASGGKNMENKQFTDDLDIMERPEGRRYTTGPVTFAPGPEEPMLPPRRAHGGKAEHGAGCRCHKCWGGKAGKAEGGKIGDVGGERPKGGRVARATGGRAKGKTNVNIIISAGHRPGADGMMTPPGMPTPPPGAAPAVMPRQAPVMPPPAAPMPMPMPPGGGGMPMPPPGAPMGRKAGGRVYRSYKDMDAGAGSGLGRLEKTEIEGRK